MLCLLPPPQQLKEVAPHKALYKQEKQRRIFETGLFVLLALLPITATIIAGNIAAFLISILSIGGLYLSWLIAQKELGLTSEVSNMLCSMVKNNRCEAVILSRGGRLLRSLSWGDVGMVYFTTTLLFIAMGSITGNHDFLYWQYMLSIAGLIFPFYSIYYQWRVVKQWCVLCLGVLAAIVLSGSIALFMLWPLSNIKLVDLFSLQAITTYISLLLLVYLAWQLLKGSIQQSIKSLAHETNALRLKRNPQIFNALLKSSQPNANNLPWVEEPIVYGNPQAPYKIVVACNPYCGPCARAHKELDRIFENHKDKLQVAIRFNLHGAFNDDKRLIAARKIIAVAKDKPMQAVHDWYETFDLQAFEATHPTTENGVEKDIEKHAAWDERAGIEGTPTFFMNGRELPHIYNWMEFLTLLDYELSSDGTSQ